MEKDQPAPRSSPGSKVAEARNSEPNVSANKRNFGDTQVANSSYNASKNANSSIHTSCNSNRRLTGAGGYFRTSEWTQGQNEERLRWAERHGFTMKDATLRFGVIDFPGLGDCLPSPEPPVRDPVRVKLWEDFLSQLEGLKIVPSLWIGLPDAARRWLRDSSEDNSRLLDAMARTCFKHYLRTFIPLHMMHTLVLASKGNKRYLIGADKRGRIEEYRVRQCLRSALGNTEDMKYSIHRVMSDAGHFPVRCREALEELFDKCSVRQVPFIFRYTFEADEGFKAEVTSELNGNYGHYKELDFNSIILPLPNGWDSDDGDLEENGRAAKKRRTDDGGLIQFG